MAAAPLDQLLGSIDQNSKSEEQKAGLIQGRSRNAGEALQHAMARP
jgi:hypothetical protein